LRDALVAGFGGTAVLRSGAMDGEEELLELGARRRVHPLLRALLVVAATAGAIVYVATRGGGSARQRANPAPAPSSESRLVLRTSPPAPVLPPWPRRTGACDNTAFLPLVTARPLDRRTGVTALVSDRLVRVDADSGRTSRVAGLPAGRYATDIGTATDGTYALLHSCSATDELAQVVRIGRDGALHPVAHGEFSFLLSGGRHPWGVVIDQSGDREWLDPLDGRPGWVLPARIAPLGAFRDSVIATITKHPQDPHSDYIVVLLDPRTGRVERNLARASSVFYGHGRVVFIEPGCRRCRLHTVDLATGRQAVTRRPVPGLALGWGVAVSPDGRSAVFIRAGSAPAPYDMEHPGTPNQIVTVDLRSGAVHPVPGVVLWSKSMPGLTFSADSRWLVIALDEGTGVRLLLWRPGLAEPRESPARITERVAYSPAVVPTT